MHWTEIFLVVKKTKTLEPRSTKNCPASIVCVRNRCVDVSSIPRRVPSPSGGKLGSTRPQDFQTSPYFQTSLYNVSLAQVPCAKVLPSCFSLQFLFVPVCQISLRLICSMFPFDFFSFPLIFPLIPCRSPWFSLSVPVIGATTTPPWFFSFPLFANLFFFR